MRNLTIVISLVSCLSVKAATYTAASVSSADVQSAIDLTTDGDTVNIPAGTGTWTTSVTCTNLITIQGAGTNQTIIIDELASRSYPPPLVLACARTNSLMRLTGIKFQGGVTNTSENIFGMVLVSCSNFETNNTKWRIDNCWFYHPNARPIVVYGWSGLIDSNRFDLNGYSGLAFDGRLDNDRGDRPWATPVQWGTVDAGVYIEHNYFTNTSARAITDCFAGTKFVFRFNTCYNVSAENHGTESTMRARGGRSMEVYGNTFIGTTAGEYAVYVRSGSALVFSNDVSGVFPGLLRMQCFRLQNSFTPWGFASGVNVWDTNSATLYDSGTHSGTNGAVTLVDSGKSWTVNQWIGYSLINTNTGLVGEISGNTATTISCYSPDFSYNQIYFTNGNHYEIRQVIKALDQPGAGSGVLLSGGSDSTSPTPTAWPNQVDEPIRYWNNTGVGTVASSSYVVQSGRDYTNAALVGYAPLTDPHPYAADSGGGGGTVSTNGITIGTLRSL